MDTAAEGGVRRFLAPWAWVDGAWRRDMLLEAGADGRWLRVGEARRNEAAAAAAQRLPGPVLPGLVDAHSHAFQRAMAGLSADRQADQDDFWSWRERMYRVALAIGPDELEAVAAWLYVELLKGGYTQVCEFHYLHRDPSGARYAQPAELALRHLSAARAAGIGLTLLPALYVASGFGAQGLRPQQRRFAGSSDEMLRIAADVQQQALLGCHDATRSPVTTGVALHSLRAVPAPLVAEMLAVAAADAPLHIHASEQTGEVDDCLAHTGSRPIDWLLAHHGARRWNLVHATHADGNELQAMARCGAQPVLCPSTEADLGDGVFALGAWLDASAAADAGQGGPRLALGSDSHAARSAAEELRLLEWVQRLQRRARNVCARPPRQPSTAAVLFEAALAGATQAAGVPLGGLAAGARADFLVLDRDCDALAGVPAERLLDAWVFSSPAADAVDEVYVAGVRRIAGGRHPREAALKQAFERAMRALWA